MKPYIQIGKDFFPVINGTIGFIEYGKRSFFASNTDENSTEVETILVTTNTLMSDGQTSVGHVISYDLGTPEADALIAWLSDKTEVLLPYEKKEPSLDTTTTPSPSDDVFQNNLGYIDSGSTF